MNKNNKGLGQCGQSVVSLFQFVIVLLILGILLYAFSPVISTIWNLNANLPNYDIARPILDLYPILAIVGLAVLYIIVRPRQDSSGV